MCMLEFQRSNLPKIFCISFLASNAEGQFFISTSESPANLAKVSETVGRQIVKENEYEK